MYERDARHIVKGGNPEEAARSLAAFKGGWTDATENHVIYKAPAVNRVTWRNLGNRFGKLIGPVDDGQQKELFEVLALLQVAPHTGETDLHELE